jgi:cytochrome c biogenesis protein CcmG/thiol:disulfide interchange protein DsbE
MKWRFAIPAVVFIALFGVFWLMLNRAGKGEYDAHEIKSPLIGKPAPKFRLPRVEDENSFVDNSKFAGRPYILNVWGTWCVECRQEHATLMAIAGQNLVPIVGLDLKDDLAQARKWLAALGNPYSASAFDAEGRVGLDWGVYGAPETFLVDAQGIVIYKHISSLTMELWEREFVPRIKHAQTATGKQTGIEQ